MSPELAAFLREEVGLVPKQGEARFPTREQTMAKNWFNTLNLEKKEDGTWEPLF